jgi:hypothetical protein
LDPEEVSQDSSGLVEALEAQNATEAPEAAPVENSTAESTETPTQEAFSGHPAWKPFEDALGPIAYRTIEPELRKMNEAFESKIRSTNESLKPWKGFVDEGVSPDELRFSRQLMQEVNNDPLGFHAKLNAYLQQAGLTPAEAAEAVEEVMDDLSEEGDDPRIKKLESELAQIREAQGQTVQAQQEWLAQQQHAQQVEQEESKLTSEIEALKTKGADDFAIGQVLERAELNYLRTGKPKPLVQIYEEWTQNVRGTILGTPRPVDSAPRLASGSGGTPSSGGTDLSTASREQSRDTLAALLAANRGS